MSTLLYSTVVTSIQMMSTYLKSMSTSRDAKFPAKLYGRTQKEEKNVFVQSYRIHATNSMQQLLCAYHWVQLKFYNRSSKYL